MGKKDYTKYSESSKETENEVITNELENNEGELETEEFTVIEENNDNIIDPEVEDQNETENEVTTSTGETEEDLKDPSIITPVDETETSENEESMKNEVEDQNETENDETTEPENTGVVTAAKVTGCTRLNVRKQPKKDAEVVCIITNENNVQVDLDNSTEDFYKISTSCNNVLIEGYCMKQYITIE